MRVVREQQSLDQLRDADRHRDGVGGGVHVDLAFLGVVLELGELRGAARDDVGFGGGDGAGLVFGVVRDLVRDAIGFRVLRQRREVLRLTVAV